MVLGILLLALYGVVMLRIAVLSIAMDGARKKPPTRWTLLRAWLIVMSIPVWAPVVWLASKLGLASTRTDGARK